jgi:ApbE superfamily uncharacterized protein (UPF0280 family)
MISLRVVRGVTLGICVAGIAGMIVTSIGGHNGAAITFGLITAVAIVCSMVSTAVAADTAHRLSGRDGAEGTEQTFPVERLAEIVEDQIQAMVSAGVDEDALRALVGESVRLGRTLESTRTRASS